MTFPPASPSKGGSEPDDSFDEASLLPVSALQHLLFCERQCSLIHLENLWAENRLTVEGQHLHEKAHAGRGESRPGVRIARTVHLRSLHLGLVGIADVVEFHKEEAECKSPGSAPPTSRLHPGLPRGQPFPVEYKRGKPKRDNSDKVQLCAQALCLEEMLSVRVPMGTLFYGRTRHRLDVPIDDALRRATEQAAARLRILLGTGVTPTARRERKCEHCSLLNLCLPGAGHAGRSAVTYIQRSLHRLDQGLLPADDEP